MEQKIQKNNFVFKILQLNRELQILEFSNRILLINSQQVNKHH